MITDEGPPPNVDALLLVVVRQVNAGAARDVAVTLSVRGAMVTGTMIGFQEYLTRFFESLGGTKADSLLPEDATQPVEPNFIHLKDAHVISGGTYFPTPPIPGILWRGRLSRVDGVSYGRFGPVSDQTPEGRELIAEALRRADQ